MIQRTPVIKEIIKTNIIAREAVILYYRQQGMKLQEIADLYNLSRQRIHQIIKQFPDNKKTWKSQTARRLEKREAKYGKIAKLTPAEKSFQYKFNRTKLRCQRENIEFKLKLKDFLLKPLSESSTLRRVSKQSGYIESNVYLTN